MHEEYETNIRLAERGYWVSRVCMLLRLPTAGLMAMTRQQLPLQPTVQLAGYVY